ncbi:MAG: hypothetical protein HY560_08810, partial [Gemmatimonadetes bacterium]|nr:hypothetical protein [Gemmatimonadota bacterium]
TASALLFGRPGARALGLAFALALAQSAALSYLAPEIGERYQQAVEQGKALIRDSVGVQNR